MRVRLHNLAAKRPVSEDLEAVIELMHECEKADKGFVEKTEESLRERWQAAHFNLNADAWLITTNKGHIAGYSDVWRMENGRLRASVYVHPAYRGRGVGTLLLWLNEERARQLMWGIPAHIQVSLQYIVDGTHRTAKRLLEREGYHCERPFWRVHINMNTSFLQELNNGKEGETLAVELVVDPEKAAATPGNKPYAARQYCTYEKVLRAAVKAEKVVKEEHHYVSA
uniref:N-acetyltransferase domain-containing protein n=1 Tax=Thermosporothrix sp. COM3 TaxID=2490863 RepID=A0A455SUI1_9CHLR|nr:hypothetical protein KTC_59090 [Thermosporothrix sp. COM3]